MSLVLDVDGRRNEVDAQAETARLFVLRNDLRATVPSSAAALVLAGPASASRGAHPRLHHARGERCAYADRDACGSARRHRESMHVVQQAFLASRRHNAATAPRA